MPTEGQCFSMGSTYDTIWNEQQKGKCDTHGRSCQYPIIFRLYLLFLYKLSSTLYKYAAIFCTLFSCADSILNCARFFHSNTYRITLGVAFEVPRMLSTELEALDTNCTARECEDYLDLFEIWWLTKSNLGAGNMTALFLHFIWKEL